MTAEEIIAANLQGLEMPSDAIEWLCDLWQATQVLDDYADGDEVPQSERDRAIYSLLAGMPSNSFYQRHQAWLLPSLSQMVLAWMASDFAERNGLADERSYVWRAGYYNVLCMCVILVHGPSSEIAFKALSLYGETYAEYIKEFSDA